MKKFLALVFIICFSISQAQAYSVKIYNESGNLIGTAKKNGDDYEIYDLEDNKVTDYDAFYASKGDESRKKLKESANFVTFENSWARVTTYPDGTKVPRSTLSNLSVWRYYEPYKVVPYKFKVYDKTGKNVGYAVKNENEDFVIYDLNDNILQTTETLYYPPGTPLTEYKKRINYGVKYYIQAR